MTKKIVSPAPPVFQIKEDLVIVSNKLKPDDVGLWAVAASNGEIIICRSKNEAYDLADTVNV